MLQISFKFKFKLFDQFQQVLTQHKSTSLNLAGWWLLYILLWVIFSGPCVQQTVPKWMLQARDATRVYIPRKRFQNYWKFIWLILIVYLYSSKMEATQFYERNFQKKHSQAQRHHPVCNPLPAHGCDSSVSAYFSSRSEPSSSSEHRYWVVLKWEVH